MKDIVKILNATRISAAVDVIWEFRMSKQYYILLEAASDFLFIFFIYLLLFKVDKFT